MEVLTCVNPLNHTVRNSPEMRGKRYDRPGDCGQDSYSRKAQGDRQKQEATNTQFLPSGFLVTVN